MKKGFIILGLFIVGLIILSNQQDTIPTSQRLSSSSSEQLVKPLPAAKPKAPVFCEGGMPTGQKYNLNADNVNVRSGPSLDSPKVINQKASKILKETHYINVDTSTQVYEECMKGEWSYIRVTEPEWLRDSHRGWIATKFLIKGDHENKSSSKISTSAVKPYTQASYPKTFAKYGPRMDEITKLREQAALMAIDSGKCDHVTMAELSMSRSTQQNLQFWVDCRNGERIYLNELDINHQGSVLTEKEKAWDDSAAIAACKQGIKDRSVLPSKVDIHSVLGTSVYHAPTTANVVVTMDFDAMNLLGQELTYTAKCYFEPGRLGNIELYNR